MLLYYITDRTAFAGNEAERRSALLRRIAEAARAGADYIQLREKDLPARELERLAHEAVRAVREGITAVNGNLLGLRQTRRFEDSLDLVIRPQEAVYAIRLMKLAFDEYFSTLAEYNRAQFELFHALGYPAQEITYLRPPGSIEPVDTLRPAYLPTVGNGPPPATR